MINRIENNWLSLLFPHQIMGLMPKSKDSRYLLRVWKHAHNQKNKSNFFSKLCNLRNHITEVKDLEKLICFMANFYYITEAVKQKNQSS
jgi:hypothetical protein